jgi:hypothetical protein
LHAPYLLPTNAQKKKSKAAQVADVVMTFGRKFRLLIVGQNISRSQETHKKNNFPPLNHFYCLIVYKYIFVFPLLTINNHFPHNFQFIDTSKRKIASSISFTGRYNNRKLIQGMTRH